MYYSIRFGWFSDDNPSRSIQACETLEEAQRKYHADLSNNIGTCKSMVCMVVGERGEIYDKQAWAKAGEDE